MRKLMVMGVAAMVVSAMVSGCGAAPGSVAGVSNRAQAKVSAKSQPAQLIVLFRAGATRADLASFLQRHGLKQTESSVANKGFEKRRMVTVLAPAGMTGYEAVGRLKADPLVAVAELDAPLAY